LVDLYILFLIKINYFITVHRSLISVRVYIIGETCNKIENNDFLHQSPIN